MHSGWGFSTQQGAPQMWRHGTVLSVNGQRIVVEDKYGTQIECENSHARAYGIHPRPGDKVIVDRSSGPWTIAGFMYPGHSFQRTWVPLAGDLPYAIGYGTRGQVVRLGDTLQWSAWGSYSAGTYQWTLSADGDPVVQTPQVPLSGVGAGSWYLTITLVLSGQQSRYSASLEATAAAWEEPVRLLDSGDLSLDFRRPHEWTLLADRDEEGAGTVAAIVLTHMPGEIGREGITVTPGLA